MVKAMCFSSIWFSTYIVELSDTFGSESNGVYFYLRYLIVSSMLFLLSLILDSQTVREAFSYLSSASSSFVFALASFVF
jgi:hypothetical protein